MAHFRRLVIFCGAFLASLGWLGAAEKEEVAQLTALWLDGRRVTDELYVADAKGQPQKLSVGVSTRGAPLSPGSPGKPVVILRKLAAAPAAPAAPGAAPAAPKYEPAGEIAWPAGGSKKILLLLAASGAPVSVRGVAIADDMTTFPVGTMRIANFLGGELFGRVGEAMKPVGPGTSAAIPYPVQSKPDSKVIANFPVGLARTGKDGKTDIIFNGRVDAWPNSRTLLLIIPGPTVDADPVVRNILEVTRTSVVPGKPKSN